MSSFTKSMLIDKLAQCLGTEKATETVNRFLAEIDLAGMFELNGEQMIKLCDRMEMEGGFMKMMASVLKIQAIMESEVS